LLLLATAVFASAHPVAGTTTYQGNSTVSGVNTTYTVTTTVSGPAVTEAGYAYNRLGKDGRSGAGTGDKDIEDCIIIIEVDSSKKVKVKVNVCDQTATVWHDADDDGTINGTEASANVPMTNHTDPPTE